MRRAGGPSSVLALAVAGLLFLPILSAAGSASVGTADPAAATSCGPGGTVTDAGRGWLTLRPSFPRGPSEVSRFAAPAFAPDVLYASNGVLLARSDDVGCSWSIVLDPAGAAGDGVALPASARLTSIAAPSSANDSSHVYVGVSTQLAALSVPAVVASNDGGETWSTTNAESGLPPLGTITEITANALNPQAARVDLGLPPANSTALFGSGDGGQTSTRRTPLQSDFAGHALRADPLAVTSALALVDGTLTRSVDGGRSFAATSPGQAPLSTYDLAVGGGGVRVAVAREGAAVVERSDDGGSSFRAGKVPLIPASIAVAPLQQTVAVADATEVYLDVPGEGAVAVSPFGERPGAWRSRHRQLPASA